MKNLFTLAALFFCLVFAQNAFAQPSKKLGILRCGTMEYYQQLFKAQPNLRKPFEVAQKALTARISSDGISLKKGVIPVDTVPVVIHVVASASLQSNITTAILQSQIDVLNEDFGGLNADSTRIPAAFKPLFGKSNIVFLLAGQNQYDEPSNGIERRVSNATFDVANADDAKQTARGGLDAWDGSKFLNLWVVSFGSTNVLGVSVFPGDPRPLGMHGFVCDYRAFGRGASYLYNGFHLGRTTTHEIGHFYGLRHIWGDDNGSCAGADFSDPSIDDTPNQSDATYGNPDSSSKGTQRFDKCSPSGAGIMYQNFMDYTDDVALVMFTKGQQQVIENALVHSPDRSPVLSSTTYNTPPVYIADARVRTISSPAPSSTQCALFTPLVILRNSGSQPLTSVQIKYSVNGASPLIYNWTGSLDPYTETGVTLPQITTTVGLHFFTAFTSAPNGIQDENQGNDTATALFEVPALRVLNGRVEQNFDAGVFPPKDWRITNENGDKTWEYKLDVGKKAPGSAWFNDWNNPTNHRYDDLVMPGYTFSNADSVILTFQVAAAVFSNPLEGIPIDTLSVLLTKDCGNTFTTVYKKWGNELQTISARPDFEFFPAFESQWRMDSVNLTQWLGESEKQFQLIFRIAGNYENNLFIDDVALYTRQLPAQLKEKGYLIFPTVTQSRFSVWHYRQPANLRFIGVYNGSGVLVWKKNFVSNAEKLITVNLQGLAAGVYFVQLGYTDKSSITQRIIKQ